METISARELDWYVQNQFLILLRREEINYVL